jgi:2-enoate reductase
MLSSKGVEVAKNKEVGINEITAENPDAVILATGSNPKIPDIAGSDLPFVYDFKKVYEKMPDLGKQIVILGGGDIGCETADMLARENTKIAVIEVLPDVLQKMKSIPREDLLKRIKGRGVDILTGTEAVLIEPGKVWIKDKEGNRYFMRVDSVILCVGSVSENSLLSPLKEKISEVYPVGEAEQTGNVGSALRSAAKVALEI